MKAKLAATFVAGLLTAVGVIRATSPVMKTPQGTTLRAVNAEVLFHHQPDGGVRTEYRACAHEDRQLTDGGSKRVAEPCWRGEFAPATGFNLAGELVGEAVKSLRANPSPP